MKPNAIWVECPGATNEGRFAHSMRDGCCSCAPYWEEFPTCSFCNKKIVADSGFCKVCRKYHNLEKS